MDPLGKPREILAAGLGVEILLHIVKNRLAKFGWGRHNGKIDRNGVRLSYFNAFHVLQGRLVMLKTGT